MAINKLLSSPQWKIVGTVSTPETGYKILYPKQGNTSWYSMTEDGYEKELSLAFYPKNGISVTNYGTASVYERELNIALGLGLTFSSNAQGSTISVVNVTTNMLKTVNTGTAGYVLAATGSNFQWIEFTAPGISGTTNYIPKFASSTTLGNSVMREDTSRILIGTTPSVITNATLNNFGKLYNAGNIYLKDSNNLYIASSLGMLLVTDQHFRIQDELGYNYLNLMTDNTGLSGAYTFSVLDNTILIGSTPSYRYLTGNLNLIDIGTSSSNLSVNIYGTGSTGILRIQDGTQGDKRVFVSNATGLGKWVSIDDSYVNFLGSKNFVPLLTGTYGLTVSGIYQGLTGGAIVIGYATPSLYDSDTNSLRVKGDVYFDNATLTKNKFFLNGSYLFDDERFNLALGYGALNGNNVATASYNIGIGFDSLKNIQDGAESNVSIGYKSQENTTSGSSNVSIGDRSMRFNEVGNFNIALGGQALMTATNSFDSVAIGYRTLRNFENGGSNISIGYGNSQNLIYGNDVVSFGKDTIGNCASASNSIVIGNGALGTLTEMENNISIGNNIANNLNDGSNYNILISDSPLGFSLTVSNTILIGNQITTGSFSSLQYNTIIGSSMSVPNGLSYSVMITDGAGNIAFLSNSDTLSIGSSNAVSGQSITLGAFANVGNGSGNISLGEYSLGNQIAGGGDNIAIGRFSYAQLGINGSVNQHNVGLGYGTFIDLVDGDYNISIGESSGLGLETGSYNILIGERPIQSGLTQSNYSIVIGRRNVFGALSNYGNVVIGNSLTVPAGLSGSILIGNGSGQIKFGSVTYSLDVYGTASIQGGGLGIKTLPDSNYDLKVAGNAYIGGKFALSNASNKSVGTVNLVAGAATVNNTSVTTSSIIFLTKQTSSYPSGVVSVTSITASVGFSIVSSNGSDTDKIGYMIVEGV